MHLLFAVILLAIGNYVHEDISDIPMAQLTIKMVFNGLIGFAVYLFSLFMFIKSLEDDRIWPWRWTWAYLGNLLFRVGTIALLGYVIFFLSAKSDSDFAPLVALLLFGVLALGVLCSEEFDVFKESQAADEIT